MNKSLYYNYQALMSKNRIYNFIVGIRGGGKTYGATEMAIKRFIKSGKKTIWLRRLATEIDTPFLNDFFNDMKVKYSDYDFMTKETKKNSGVAYGLLKRKEETKRQKFILFIPLSITLKHKSTNLNAYDLLIFDEFLIDTVKTNMRYLNGRNEPHIFLEFFESFARTRNNVRAIFIGNAISTVNPYFDYLNITFDKTKEWLLTESVCVHNYKNENFKKEKLKTAYGKFLANTEYGKYNLDNEFINESDDFIEERTPKALLCFNLFYLGSTYGVWSDDKVGKLYISKTYDKTAITYCLTTDDMKPNLLIIDKLKTSTTSVINLYIKRAFKGGYLRYESQGVKQACLDMLKYII